MKQVLKSIAAAVLMLSIGVAAHAGTPAPQTKMIPEAANTTYTGSFVFNINMTIKPGLPATGYPLMCTVTVSGMDMNGLMYTETKTSLAVRSGSTATCSNLTLYYAWSLADTSMPVNTQYEISAQGSGTSLVYRMSTGNLASVSLPANGTTLTRTINVTL